MFLSAGRFVSNFMFSFVCLRLVVFRQILKIIFIIVLRLLSINCLCKNTVEQFLNLFYFGIFGTLNAIYLHVLRMSSIWLSRRFNQASSLAVELIQTNLLFSAFSGLCQINLAIFQLVTLFFLIFFSSDDQVSTIKFSPST